MNNNFDTIIIGAGFAGVTAARELSQKGYRVLILEGRDRLGGRTWVDHRMGKNLEMGGTWVHWFQAHIWSEISRYGLEVIPSPSAEKAYWIANGIRHEGSAEDLYSTMTEAMDKFLEDTFKYFPFPHKPFMSDQLKEIDHLSVADKLNELNLSKEEHDLVESVWTLLFNGEIKNASLSQAYRWAAVAHNNFELLMEVLAGYKLATGTKGLIESIFSDFKGDILYSKCVSAVHKINDNYKVITTDGEEFNGKAVISTVPINTLKNIEFEPALHANINKAIGEGSATNGVKCWAKVEGLTTPFEAWAPEDYPITYAQLEFVENGNGIVVGFGSDSNKLDPNNKLEVEKALRHFIPDAKVLESTGNDWANDQFSQGTWYMQRKNHLTDYLFELQKMQDGLFMAGSDYGGGAQGLMDGAIESAYTASRLVENYLTEKKLDRVIN